MKLLITRPLRQSKLTADSLSKLGHTCIIDPLLRVEQISTVLPEQIFSGIILTSANALPTLDKTWPATPRTIPVLATGQTTATAARDYGFTNYHNIQGSALKLVEQTPKWMEDHNIPKGAKLLYPCAEEPAHDLEALLKQQNITCHPWQTYRTVPTQTLSPTTRSAITDGTLDGVLLYSARTAKAFEDLIQSLPKPSKPLHIFTLSSQICAVLSKNPAFACHFPHIPDETVLFDIIQQIAQ